MRLRDFMEEHRWTPTNLGKKTGLTKGTIINLRDGKQKANRSTAKLIELCTDGLVTVEDLDAEYKEKNESADS